MMVMVMKVDRAMRNVTSPAMGWDHFRIEQYRWDYRCPKLEFATFDPVLPLKEPKRRKKRRRRMRSLRCWST